jgi:two-component system heavy metal sensor histidine kinase CusS
MSMRLQYRAFMYQAILLVAFVFLQLLVFSIIEYRDWRDNHHEETLAENLQEVVDVTAMNVLLLPLMFALVWWFSRRILNPVRRIAETASHIGGGRFGERINTRSMPDDDMRHLAETLNAAFEHYTSAVHRLRRFSGDASHQLRTPIAAMRATGEVAVSRPRSADDYRAAIADMLTELERLSFMIEQLLQLSRLDAGTLRERFVPFEAEVVVRQSAQIYSPLCEDAGITLEFQAEPGIVVPGIEALACELLNNLLDNAIRHTPRGGAIHLGVCRAAGGIRFYVHDSGPGIPVAFADTVFERFSQIPGGRHGGAGLGLALAADIAAVHGGKLTVVNPGSPGARFEWIQPLRLGAALPA